MRLVVYLRRRYREQWEARTVGRRAPTTVGPAKPPRVIDRGDPREAAGLREGDGGVYPDVDRLKHPADRWMHIWLGRLSERFTSREIDRWSEVTFRVAEVD